MTSPLAPILGQVIPAGVTVQQGAGVPLTFAAEDALQVLRPWATAADVILEGLSPPETLYPMSEASGSTVTDVIRGTVLTASGRAHVGQRAAGIFTGRDFHGRRAVELADAAGAGAVTAASAAPHAYGSSSFAVLIAFRALYFPAATAGILGTRDAAGAGWRLEIQTNGRLQAVISDGSTTITLVESGTYVVTTGGWGWALLVVNRSAGTATLSSSFAVAPASTSLAGLSSLAGATAFRLGAFTASPAHPRCQIERMATWVGQDAEAMSGGRLSAWWRHGQRTAWMTSYAWSGKGLATTVEVDDGLGDILAPWSPGQVMIGRHPAITRNARQIGLVIPRGLQSRINVTELSAASWAATSATKAVADRDDPLCYRGGVKVTKSGAGGKIRRALDIVGVGTLTASVWVWWDGTNTAPRLRVRNAADSATLVEATFAGATSQWVRLSATWVSPGLAELVELHASDPAAAAGAAWFSHAQVDSGTVAGPLQPDNGIGNTASAVIIKALATGARAGRGTMRAWWIALDQDVATATTGGSVASLSTAHGSSAHQRSLHVLDATEAPEAHAHNAAAALTSTASATPPADWATAESEMIAYWDESEVDGFSVAVFRNGVLATTGANLGAPGDALIEALYVGSDPGEIRALHGILSLLEVWPGAIADL